MIKKKFDGKIHRINETGDNQLWFFYGLNTKLKRIKPQKQSQKRRLLSIGFFILNLVVLGGVLAFQINSDAGVGSISALFSKQNNSFFLVLACLCFIVSELLVGIRLHVLGKKFNKKSKFFSCMKSEFICQYYSKLTPFAVGGQPFQVYSLNKSGFKANNAITMVSCNYVSHKLIYWLVSLAMMLTIATNSLVKKMSGASFKIVLNLAIISLAFMSVYLTFVILICLNKKIASNLVAFAIRILYKLRIVKNRKKVYFKVMRPALSFQHKMKKFFTTKKLAFISLLLSLIIYLIQSSIPACIYFIFKPFSFIDYWRLLSMAVIIQLSFGVNPIPGGSGVAELSFYAVFTVLIDKSLLFWALMIWRILTYYIYLLIGFGIFVYNNIVGLKRKNKKKSKIVE